MKHFLTAPSSRFPADMFGLVVLLALTGTAAAVVFPKMEQLPVQTNLPDPLVQFEGTRVTSASQWTDARRPELKALFQQYMYGYFPPPPGNTTGRIEREDRHYFGGKATKKEITLAFGPPAAPRIHLLLVVPNHRAKPAPVVVGLNFNGNHTVLDDPTIALPRVWMPAGRGVTNNQATEAGRGIEINTWAIEPSIDRGYAIATFYNGDIDPDRPDFTDGIHPHYFRPGQTQREPQDWGTIAAYAWGLQRAVDYLITDPDLDRDHVAVFGHSRNGKAALLAGAFDERVALVFSHQAGCGGSAPSRGKLGESVKQINDRFPHWFSDEFKKFNDQPERLPFDQHCLVALVAPRSVLLSNATEDTWANPPGQFALLQAADPVYRLLQAGGLEASQMPEVGQLVDSRLGFFIRAGRHSTTREDWKVFLDFADRHFGKPAAAP